MPIISLWICLTPVTTQCLELPGQRRETATVQHTAGAAGLAPLPSRLPYVADSGKYTQWWLTETVGLDAAELAKECEVYLIALTGTTADYPGIISSLLSAADRIVFLKVLQGNQVCIGQSVGRFSCGLGRPTAAHNRIFGLMGEKVGGSLPPIAMVPTAGLVQWIQLETQIKTMETDLEGLAADPKEVIVAPVGTVSAGARPLVEVQILVMVPRAWAPYFLEPQLPWETLGLFENLMGNITNNIKDSFEFIETCFHIACTKATETEDSVVREK